MSTISRRALLSAGAALLASHSSWAKSFTGADAKIMQVFVGSYTNGHAELGSPACWGMLFDPSGKWALAAAQIGDAIVVYSVDQNTDVLEPTGQTLKSVLPSCLRWA